MSDRWDMRVSLQSGETEKLTGVFDGLRIDRLALAIDAVEIYNDRRDLTGDTGTGPPDGRPDLVAPAARGTGTIVCNVQRYNPTAAQLAAVAAIQGTDQDHSQWHRAARVADRPRQLDQRMRAVQHDGQRPDHAGRVRLHPDAEVGHRHRRAGLRGGACFAAS